MIKKDIIGMMIKRKSIIIISFFMFTLGSVLFNYGILTSQYRATARIAVEAPGPERCPAAPASPDYKAIMRSVRATEVENEAFRLLNKPKGFTPDKLRERAIFDVDRPTGEVLISFDDPNPKKCAGLANIYAEAFINIAEKKDAESLPKTAAELSKQADALNGIITLIKAERKSAPQNDPRLQTELNAAQQLLKLTNEQISNRQRQSAPCRTYFKIVQPAAVPDTPVSPDRKRNINLSMLLGMIVGAAIALLLEDAKGQGSAPSRNIQINNDRKRL